MDIDLRDLELLEALERQPTLTAAAQTLFVSQPALSQRLLRLEQRLGTSLFERTGGRLVVNPTGKRMVQASRIALHEIRDAIRDVHDMRTDSRELVRLWSQCTTNYQWLPEVLRTFRQQRPSAEVTIETVADTEHIAALLDGRLDVALVTKLHPQLDRVRLHRLFDDELVAVVRAGHPWASRVFVDADDFADVHLVLFDSYDPDRTPAVPLPIPPGATPGRLSTLPLLTDLLIETIISTDAVTVLPSWIAAPYLPTGNVVAVQVGRPPQSRTWYCATRHGVMDPTIAAFVNTLTVALAEHGSQ
jgi:LysR family transcriptional regulator, regulator for metE and metH